MKIASLRSAKRKTQIRKYIEKQYMQSRQMSDPFEDDDAEFEKYAFNISTKFRDFSFDSSDSESDECGDKDGILIRPDLVEAEKFISSLKLRKGSKMKSKKPVNAPVHLTMCQADVENFKNECEKMKMYRMKEIDDESDVDDKLI